MCWILEDRRRHTVQISHPRSIQFRKTRTSSRIRAEVLVSLTHPRRKTLLTPLLLIPSFLLQTRRLPYPSKMVSTKRICLSQSQNNCNNHQNSTIQTQFSKVAETHILISIPKNISSKLSWFSLCWRQFPRKHLSKNPVYIFTQPALHYFLLFKFFPRNISSASSSSWWFALQTRYHRLQTEKLTLHVFFSSFSCLFSPNSFPCAYAFKILFNWSYYSSAGKLLVWNCFLSLHWSFTLLVAPCLPARLDGWTSDCELSGWCCCHSIPHHTLPSYFSGGKGAPFSQTLLLSNSYMIPGTTHFYWFILFFYTLFHACMHIIPAK